MSKLGSVAERSKALDLRSNYRGFESRHYHFAIRSCPSELLPVIA